MNEKDRCPLSSSSVAILDDLEIGLKIQEIFTIAIKPRQGLAKLKSHINQKAMFSVEQIPQIPSVGIQRTK
jgi:hypothetical protein